ncbi:uncharacterized protein A4U43_C04F13880 [Asparagus officinalis]|uniref:Homeobox domain-containing protein n=1 Tax=Asparagus officinalis TaxID=4686 RepID=A0A5P1F5H3_ASPOF|nr:WUSCHEL-related homeobox 8-like [Asparagus officinalis]ONK71931.1 uncharacterized protein A4U43_C04F13880 [Asparagus officinalis]
MDWPKASPSSSSSNRNIGDHIKREVDELMMMMGPVKVMTDEQIEVLRQQISMFAAICEQLVEMHKSMTSPQSVIAGTSFQYYDPLMMPGSTPKITSRQRWTPTPAQLQILESVFSQGIGTPSKQKIKELTSELLQHGKISETNVYNWFQNRRARSKRKHAATPSCLSVKSEAERENDCSNLVKQKSGKIDSFQIPEGNPELHSTKNAEDSLRSFYQGQDQLMGEMGIPAGLSYFQCGNR